MAATHQIVILGSSFAGLGAAHGLLKDVIPALSKEGKQSYKVIMISPSDSLWFKVAAPRVIVNPASLPLEKALLPIANGFKKYPVEQFEFIHASATSIDPTSKTVALSTSTSVHYDTLILATGTYFKSAVWSVTDGVEPMKKALADLQERIPKAETILVAGGGPAGIETAGELAELYAGKKEMTFLSGSTQALSRLNNKKVGQDAESRLAKSGFTVINNVQVTSSAMEGGKEVLQLSDGTTKTVDVYIEATGDKPSSSYVPAAWLSEKGYVKTNPNTLRLEVPGVTGVYCIGSVGDYSNGSLFDATFSTPALVESVKLDLQGIAPGPRTKKIYKKFQSDMQLVPMGSTGGVGIVFGYKIPSFMVKIIKAKDFFIGNAPKAVNGS